MGLSSSKQKTSNAPWAPAQPAILHGLQAGVDTYDKNQPALQDYATQQAATYGKVAPGAESGIQGAQGLVNDTLAGKYINANPYLQGMIDTSNAGIRDNVNSNFEAAGRYGSGYNSGILAKRIGENENAMRMQNYMFERGNQNNAVGQAGNLMQGSQSLLNNAAELPWIGVGALNGNVRQASQGYGTTTQTSTPAYGPMLMNAAAAAAQAAAASDIRLKTNVECVGELPTGLGIYEWEYDHSKGVELPEGRYRGVMAHEVALHAPELLGPPLNGYQTVYYTPERIG